MSKRNLCLGKENISDEDNFLQYKYNRKSNEGNEKMSLRNLNLLRIFNSKFIEKL